MTTGTLIHRNGTVIKTRVSDGRVLNRSTIPEVIGYSGPVLSRPNIPDARGYSDTDRCL